MLMSTKHLFTMCVPEILEQLPPKSTVALVGIESHICITQTTLDFLSLGHSVFVIADGVSSCNAEEVPIALRRLQTAGAIVTTSESFMYQVVKNANVPGFKGVAALVKQYKDATKSALQALPGTKI